MVRIQFKMPTCGQKWSKLECIDYEMIYNRYEEANSNMAFLNQQYGRMAKGHELLSEGYILKVHENTTANAEHYLDDLLMLRSKILSVNQTVHDNFMVLEFFAKTKKFQLGVLQFNIYNKGYKHYSVFGINNLTFVYKN